MLPPQTACSDSCFNGLTMFLFERRSEAPLCTKAATIEAASWVDSQALVSGTERTSEIASVDICTRKSPMPPTVQPMDEHDSPQPGSLRRISSLNQRFEALTAFLDSPCHAQCNEDMQLVCDRGRPRTPRSFSLDVQDGDASCPVAACAGHKSQQRASSLELRFAALASEERYAFANRIVMASCGA